SCEDVHHTCTATTAGDRKVAATDGTATGTKSLTVNAAGLDHLVVGGGSASIAAGGPTAAYSTEGFDHYDNDLGDKTSESTLSIAPDGSCEDGRHTCTATTAGPHTVTATDGTATGTKSLTVNAAGLDHLVAGGGSASIAAGGPTAAYSTEGFDHYDNDLGDKTSASTLSITPDGSC